MAGPSVAASNYTPKPPTKVSVSVPNKPGTVTVTVKLPSLPPHTRFAGCVFTFVRSGSTKSLVTTNLHPTWTWLRSKTRYSLTVQTIAMTSPGGAKYTSGKTKAIYFTTK